MMGTNQSPDTGRDGSTDSHPTRDTIADLMPWMATILLHFAAVLIAVIYVWSTIDRTPVEDPVVPVISSSFDRPKPLALREYRQPVKTPPSGPRSPVPLPVTNPVQASKTQSPLAFGVNGGPTFNEGKFSTSPGGVGTGTIFKDPGGEVGSKARSYVFVIDASGSMIDTLPFVVAELKRAVRTLTEEHTFAVLFYQNDAVVQALRPGMLQATQGNKAALFDWLDGEALAPAGLSSPLKAIELGLQLKPQVMFLLSDNITGAGRYEINQTELLARVKRANQGSTKISTIQFLYPDQLVRIPGMKPTLERISEQSNGLYKFLSARELGL